MDKLPLEILHRIFIQLDLQQRLICLLVCRNWWRILDSYSLFYDINLCGDPEKVQILSTVNRGEDKYRDRFNKIINMFEQLPAQAALVQELYVKPHPNLRKLLNIFPNVRVIKVESDWRLNHHHLGKHIDITHSKSKVEFLADSHNCELASQLLYSNLGSHLKTLCLDFGTLPNVPTFISQLKDLPVLKKLSLKGKVSFHALENIHKDLPSIQDFSLEYIRIEPGSLPLDISPATGITKFKYYRGRFDNSDIHTTFYHYMTRKYINVTDIEYEDDMIRSYAPDIAKQVYLNGVFDFFSAITLNKGKIGLINSPDDIDPFLSLDTGGSKIQKLGILFCPSKSVLQHFSRSNQFKHVEELTFHNADIDPIHTIKDMPALTTLRILFTSARPILVHLADCLTACPSSLRTLSIECFNMEIDPFENKLNFIENLDINVTTITSGLGDIISSCFPSLVNLKLRGMVEDNVNITLNSPHLRKFTFASIPFHRGRYCNHGVSFKSPHQKNAKYYYCHEKEITRVPYKHIKQLPVLSIKSLTEKALHVDEDITILSKQYLFF